MALKTTSSAFNGLNPWNIPGTSHGDDETTVIAMSTSQPTTRTSQSSKAPQQTSTRISGASSSASSSSGAAGSIILNLAATTGSSTFITAATGPITTAIDTNQSMVVIDAERHPSPRVRKIAVGLAVPATILLLVGTILFCMYLRNRYRSKHTTTSSRSPENAKKHQNDFNAKPLYPHKPLASRSNSIFTTDAGPSYGSIPKPDDPKVPQLPEMEGLTAAYSPTRESDYSSDDFGTYFSGLDDPFTDAAVSSTHKMTPGVSPSSYPLRDRLSHESERRRKAIESLRRKGSRSSISERELGDLIGTYEGIDSQKEGLRKVRVRSEEDIWRGVERGRDQGEPAELTASLPLR